MNTFDFGTSFRPSRGGPGFLTHTVFFRPASVGRAFLQNLAVKVRFHGGASY